MIGRIVSRRSAFAVGAFLLLILTLALLQLWLLQNTTPPADGISYFEVADQIPRVGYGKALPQHWSPLYPLYLLAIRTVAPAPLDRELLVTAAGDTLLLVTLCVVVMLVFRSLGRLCWPDDAAPRLAWLTYGCGLAVFFAFAILRVGLRMPDALVTSLAVATLWVWCQASARHLSVKWAAAAGVLSGVSYLARANLLHWSLVVGVVACVLAPGVLPRRRFLAFGAFCLGLVLVFGPQSYVFPPPAEVSRSARRASSGLPMCTERYGRAAFLHGRSCSRAEMSGCSPNPATCSFRGSTTPVESSTTRRFNSTCGGRHGRSHVL
jgi:hypothetical protein